MHTHTSSAYTDARACMHSLTHTHIHTQNITYTYILTHTPNPILILMYLLWWCVLFSGETPLHEAAGNDFLLIPELLLQHGAYVDATNDRGKMWLIRLYCKHIDISNNIQISWNEYFALFYLVFNKNRTRNIHIQISMHNYPNIIKQ